MNDTTSIRIDPSSASSAGHARASTRSRNANAGTIERERVGDRVTIYKMKCSPSWYMQFNVDRTQHRTSLKTASKKRALELARTKDAELVLGIAQEPARRSPTISDTISKYIDALRDRGRSQRSLVIYQRDLGQFALWCNARGVTKLADVNADALEQFQRQLLARGYTTPIAASAAARGAREAAGATNAAAGRAQKLRRGRRPGKPYQARTVRSKMKTIRTLINFAMKRQMIAKEPAPGYDLPPDQKKRAVCWDPGELKAVLDHANPTVLPLLNFLRLTGLRSDELCWLTHDDFDEARNLIRVRAKTCPQSGERWRPKHGKERILPLCPEALAIARSARDACGGPWLFSAPSTGKRQPGKWNVERIWRAVKSAMKMAGVERGTTHTLRHCYCSFLANQGVPPFAIMRLMGHGSLDIVLTYSHTSDKQLAEAIAAVQFTKMLAESGGGETANVAKN